jgi:hypothetical protein
MSRNINVNPAHYKVAGRERQGEAILQSAQKQMYGQQHANLERWQARQPGGTPGWEDPAQPVADAPEPVPARKKPSKRKAAKSRSASKVKRTRRTASSGRRTRASASSSKRRGTKRPSTRSTRSKRATQKRR